MRCQGSDWCTWLYKLPVNRQEQKKSEPKAQDETKRSLRVQLSEFRFCSKLFQQLLIVTTLQEKLKMGDKTRKMPRLWHLCVDGKLDEVRSALARGEDVNDKDSIGTTALMWAVMFKHNSIVKLLLDQPAVDVNVKDNLGLTALHHAADKNNAEGAKMLLLHKDFNSANMTDTFGTTALIIVIQKKHNLIVKQLLDQPAVDVNVKDKRGRTLLHIAAESNNAEGARMLLLHKDFNSANVTDNGCDTALMYAVIHRNEEVLRELVSHQCVSLDVGRLAGEQR